MHQLWTKAPDEHQWKRNYITPNKDLPSDRKYEQELKNLGYQVKWVSLKGFDF